MKIREIIGCGAPYLLTESSTLNYYLEADGGRAGRIFWNNNMDDGDCMDIIRTLINDMPFGAHKIINVYFAANSYLQIDTRVELDDDFMEAWRQTKEPLLLADWYSRCRHLKKADVKSMRDRITAFCKDAEKLILQDAVEQMRKNIENFEKTDDESGHGYVIECLNQSPAELLRNRDSSSRLPTSG